MTPQADPHRPADRRRRDVRRTYANALLWALGNGLVSTFLVGYLAQDLGAGSVAVAWLVAAPRFASVLRLAAPWLLRASAARGMGRKPLCVGGYFASAAVLAVVPTLAWGASSDSAIDNAGRIAALALAWCVYHLLEYVATVYLWSWIGDLYPRRLRSRLLGGRERRLTAGRFVGIGASITLAWGWQAWTGDPSARTPLAVSAAAGAILMVTAVVPLLRTTPYAARPSATPAAPWRTLAAALRERPYRRLLVYHGWLAFSNGLTGTAHFVYPRVIGIGYATIQSCFATMWVGQSLAAPWFGRLVGRCGARRVMLPAQLLVATGPLWFLFASRDAPGWIAGAYVVWIAYAAVNIGLDTLKLGLADPRNNAPYLAVFHAVGDLLNGVTILAGGLLYETLSAGDDRAMRVYAGLFVAGWVCRTLAAPLVWGLAEPDRRG